MGCTGSKTVDEDCEVINTNPKICKIMASDNKYRDVNCEP